MPPILAPDQESNSLSKVPSGSESYTVLQFDLVCTARERMYCENAARVNDVPPMNTQELVRIKLLFDSTHGFIQQVRLIPTVQLNVVVGRFDPVH